MSRRETPGYHGLSSEENANTEWGRMVVKRGEVSGSRPYCGCTHDRRGTRGNYEDGQELFRLFSRETSLSLSLLSAGSENRGLEVLRQYFPRTLEKLDTPVPSPLPPADLVSFAMGSSVLSPVEVELPRHGRDHSGI